MKNSFEEWVQEIAEGASNREIAMKAGIPMTTFHRKWTKGEFTAEDAVTIARAYGRAHAGRSPQRRCPPNRGIHDARAQP